MSMNKITESAIENFAIELLEKQGYQYLYAPSIAPDRCAPRTATNHTVSGSSIRKPFRPFPRTR